MTLRTRILALAAAVGGALVVTAPAPARPFTTAIFPDRDDPGTAALISQRVSEAGATRIRIAIRWRNVVPGPDRPVPFDAENPDDPNYNWSLAEPAVAAAQAQGLEPFITIYSAPRWAEGVAAGSWNPGSVRPSPAELAMFATAAARKFPDVRYWEVWNEPNLKHFLSPQEINGRLVAPTHYRRLVNAAATALHVENAANIVIGGALSSLGRKGHSTSPLRFMRSLLCLNRKLQKACNSQAIFDAWSTHPYTTGGPTHRAYNPEDVAIGDLPEMRRVLVAAKQRGRIVSNGMPEFWVTEFSWDTKLPDPAAVPETLHARWVAEALYRMWKAQVTTVTWFKVRDNPFPAWSEQCGLWFNGGPDASDDGQDLTLDTPKLALTAFRFPFVALPGSRSTIVWGRVPGAVEGTQVLVERRKSDGSWRPPNTLTTDAWGVFSHRFPWSMSGATLRARLSDDSEISLPFVVKTTRDIPYPPFGSG